ncbi:hypothetical protein BGX31_001715 [Mortierella sp. GBA43]|nr:hypothetical protein BGX31_001715 [Mortierella sp. GBA43]
MTSISTNVLRERLSLSDPSAVAPYFVETPPCLWRLRGFCDAEFERNHQAKSTVIYESFKKSTQYIQDAEEIPQEIRDIAKELDRGIYKIMKVWRQCRYDKPQESSTRPSIPRKAKEQNVWRTKQQQSQGARRYARPRKLRGAKQNAAAAATLTPPTLNQHQLEDDGSFVGTVKYESDENASHIPSLSNGDTSGSENTNDMDGDHQDSKMGILERSPERIDWLVGPGDLSSRLETGVLWKMDDTNISQDLSDRRSEVMLILEQIVDPDILALRNVYTPKVMQDVMSINHWTDSVELWQREYECNLNGNELADVVLFAHQMHTRTTLRQARARACDMDATNPLNSIIKNYLRTSVLWNGQLGQIHEDTFIDDFVKPVMDGLFGDLADCTMHWRGVLQCGPNYANEEKLYPEFFLSMKGHAVTILEAEAPNKSVADYRDVRLKLYDQMKLSIDGLLSSGIATSVVGFRVSGTFHSTFLSNNP